MTDRSVNAFAPDRCFVEENEKQAYTGGALKLQLG